MTFTFEKFSETVDTKSCPKEVCTAIKTLVSNFDVYIKTETPGGFSKEDEIISFVSWALGLPDLVEKILAEIKDIVIASKSPFVHEYLQFTCEIKTSFLDALSVVTLNGNDEEIEKAGALIYYFKYFYENWEGELLEIGAWNETSREHEYDQDNPY